MPGWGRYRPLAAAGGERLQSRARQAPGSIDPADDVCPAKGYNRDQRFAVVHALDNHEMDLLISVVAQLVVERGRARSPARDVEQTFRPGGAVHGGVRLRKSDAMCSLARVIRRTQPAVVGLGPGHQVFEVGVRDESRKLREIPPDNIAGRFQTACPRSARSNRKPTRGGEGTDDLRRESIAVASRKNARRTLRQ